MYRHFSTLARLKSRNIFSLSQPRCFRTHDKAIKIIPSWLGVPLSNMLNVVYTPIFVFYDDIDGCLYYKGQAIARRDPNCEYDMNKEARRHLCFAVTDDGCRFAEFFGLPKQLRNKHLMQIDFGWETLKLNLIARPDVDLERSNPQHQLPEADEIKGLEKIVRCSWAVLACGCHLLLAAVVTTWNMGRLFTEFLPLVTQRYAIEAINQLKDKPYKCTALLAITCLYTVWSLATLYNALIGQTTWFFNYTFVQPIRAGIEKFLLHGGDTSYHSLLAAQNCLAKCRIFHRDTRTRVQTHDNANATQETSHLLQRAKTMGAFHLRENHFSLDPDESAYKKSATL